MFTVKATYNSVTRRFTFEEDAFPSYEQLTSQVRAVLCITPPPLTAPLSSQLYKAFSITNAFYLSDILLSPNPNAPNSRIMVARQAHSAADYARTIKSYQLRSWPGAVMRFIVNNETVDSDTITPEQTPLDLEDGGLKVGSKRWSATSTAINLGEGSDVSQAPEQVPEPGRSSTAETLPSYRTFIENEHLTYENERRDIEDERRTILERIREHTFSRVANGPTIPAASSSASNFIGQSVYSVALQYSVLTCL